ncbi:chromosomal replication initiator protein DnaA [Actinomyces trachealis]|uniref:chromosomal replication initiator protein DnaA n=1 Tax=Actinomyces trachealis TaxID=2763540 RepID=UPI001892949D|nr:chromosomal replication initiator protein DnaA [Actinomyces trachealis]
MSDSATTQWRDACDILAATSGLGPGKLSIIRTTRAVDVDGTIVLIVGSAFARDVIAIQAYEQIKDALAQVLGHPVDVEVTVDTSLETAPAAWLATHPPRPEPPAPLVPRAPVTPVAVQASRDERMVPTASPVPLASTAATPAAGPSGTPLNPRYTFDTYVSGPSNNFAYATAVAVAEAPAKAYNPLFIYGGSGLGKTHLLHAIGHYARSLFPDIKVTYVNSEEFLSDFINSVGDQERIDGFKRRYRQVDILLIDDIQFLQGKEGTLEEFFHTFNALHTANKQVVLTSDQPPKALGGFEERLRSRFAEGLIVDVQPPDLETRTVILSKKARVEGLNLPNDVLDYIASRITTNIRELEGALIRVTAFASLTKQPVDRTLAEKVLKDIITDPGGEEITVPLIMAQTADYFGITIDELCSRKRSKTLVTARHIAMYLCRELTDLSLPIIGREFGGKDHTTVMNADKKIRTQMAERRETYNHVAEITSRIKQAAQVPRPA